MGVRSKIFSDFGLILGPYFESFLSSDGLNSVFFWSLFPGHFLHRFLMELLTAGALKTRFSLGRYCKNMFSQKTFIGDSRADFFCFLEALGAGFLSFSALETGLKIQCFSRSLWGP